MVGQMIGELVYFNEVFASGGAVEAAPLLANSAPMPQAGFMWGGGSLTATGVFKDETIFPQPPLPQTVTFVRNARYDPKRSFLIISDHE